MDLELLGLIVLAALVVILLVVVMQQRRALHGASRRPDSRDSPQTVVRSADPVFDLMPFHGMRVDRAGTIVETNRKARDRFPHAILGRSLLEAFGEHRLSEVVDECIETGEPQTLELRLFSKDRRTYRVQLEPIGEAEDREALIYMTDLTEAVAYEELRSQFVANVSHELRTPLTGLGGLLEALEDPELDRETHDRFVARATKEIFRLDHLLTDILFLSELESQPGRPSGDLSNLTAVLDDVVESLHDLAERQQVTLTVQPGPETWVAISDAMLITITRNLIENAVRYAGPMSSTVAEVHRAPPPAGRIGQWVELRVQDDGVGIPERHLPHIFERFYRADPSRSKQMGGTGLGLSIVKHIAERVGGEVAARSREGFGTTISVVLPAGVAPVNRDDPTAGVQGE